MTENDDTGVLEAYRNRNFLPGTAGWQKPILLSPDELLPEARAHYQAALKGHGVDAIPIIMDRSHDKNDSSFLIQDTANLGDASNVRTGVGQYIVVSEYAHRWSMDYMLTRILPKDADLAKRTEVTFPELLAENERLAQLNNVHPTPKLYYWNDRDPETSHNYAGRTVEGTRFIVIDPATPQGAQMAILAHEMGHHADDRSEFTTMLALHNQQDGQRSRRYEQAADKAAVRACRGEQLGDYLDMAYAENKKLVEATGQKYDIAYQRREDPDHDPLDQRLADVRRASKAAEAAGLCPIPQQVAAGLRGVEGVRNVSENGPPARAERNPGPQPQR